MYVNTGIRWNRELFFCLTALYEDGHTLELS